MPTLQICIRKKTCKIETFAHIAQSIDKNFQAGKWNIIFSGIHGEHTETTGGVFDISNKARLGVTEYDCVKHMYDGVKKLIEMEKSA